MSKCVKCKRNEIKYTKKCGECLQKEIILTITNSNIIATNWDMVIHDKNKEKILESKGEK